MSNVAKWLFGLGIMFAVAFCFMLSIGTAMAQSSCAIFQFGYFDTMTLNPNTPFHFEVGSNGCKGHVVLTSNLVPIAKSDGSSLVFDWHTPQEPGIYEVCAFAVEDTAEWTGNEPKRCVSFNIVSSGSTAMPTVDLSALSDNSVGPTLTLPPTSMITGKRVQVNTTNLNLRTLPSPFAPVIVVAPKGTVFVYVGQTTDCDGTLWYSVKDDAHAGWLKGKFSSLEDGTTVNELHPDCSSLTSGAATATPTQYTVDELNTAVAGTMSAYLTATWTPTPTATPTLVGAAAAGTPSAIGTIVPCVGAPPSRLFGLTAARSTPDGEPLAIRALPGSDAAKLGSIANGESVEITGAPKCHSGMYWYPVTYLGVPGWSAEGIQGKWFLESVDQTVEPTAEG